MKLSHRLRIRGQKWKIIFGRPPANKCDALCVPDERLIYIRPSANKTKKLQRGAIIHEILHAALYDLSEEAVLEVEDALNEALAMID